MRRPVNILHGSIISWAGILIFDHHRDWCSGREPLKDAAHNTDTIGLASLCSQAALPGTAAIEFPLYDLFIKRQSWRATVDDDADRISVTLAPTGDPEQHSKRVARHNV